MKISTIRSLLILLDLLLFASICGVVYLGLQERDVRKKERQDYQKKVNERLARAKPETIEKWTPPRGRHIDVANLENKAPPPPPETNQRPTVDPGKKIARPLDTLVALVGTEVYDDDDSALSFVFYKRLDEAPASVSASKPASLPDSGRARRNGRGNPRVPPRRNPRTPPPPPSTGPIHRLHEARENEVIEFSGHEVALVKKVKQGSVVFEYDGKEETLLVPTDPTGDNASGSSGGDADPAPTGPINPDPGTWIAWVPAKPNEINITPMGMRAFQDKGESALQGVRWSTERLPDGKQAVKVTRIPKDSPLRRGGAQEGDLIESINGVRVSSKAEIVAYVKANPNLPAYKVKFRRGGRIYTRVVRPPKRGGGRP